MLHISNLRKIQDGEAKLIADVSWDGENIPKLPSQMWFAVKNGNTDMLANDVYDAFFLIPLYMGMYYKHDLYIHGSMSKKLYKNTVNYLERILCDFSDDLSKINIKVDGFKEAEGNQTIIGTGISCGVDSLTTIYDRYINEDDPDYKINALFSFYDDTHETYLPEKFYQLWLNTCEMRKQAADELGLPFYQVDSNLLDFTYNIEKNGQTIFFIYYSYILALGTVIKKYYTSSSSSYKQILDFSKYHGDDFSEFAESYAVPLIQTERLELIIDGCQYERTQKTEHISNWKFAQKYLNVCQNHLQRALSSSWRNCSYCGKCLRTLSTLEAIGKLEEFSNLFDLDIYNKNAFKYKCTIVINKNQDRLLSDIYNYSRARGVKFPPYFIAWLRFAPSRIKILIKKLTKAILGKTIYLKIKKLVKGHE